MRGAANPPQRADHISSSDGLRAGVQVLVFCGNEAKWRDFWTKRLGAQIQVLSLGLPVPSPSALPRAGHRPGR